MRVVVSRHGNHWIEDWDCKTERAVKAAMTLKYGQGREPEEIDVLCQYSIGWSVNGVEVKITKHQPPQPEYTTPITAVPSWGRGSEIERLRISLLRRMDQSYVEMQQNPEPQTREGYRRLRRHYARLFEPMREGK